MKKTLLCFALLTLIAPLSSQAQKWSAGYRSGISQDNLQFNDQFAQGHNLIWNNQVFLNRKLGKRWGAEISFNYCYVNNGETFTDIGTVAQNIHQQWQTKSYTITLSARYFLLEKNNWEIFGQAGLSTRFYTNHFQVTRYAPATGTYEYNAGKDVDNTPSLDAFTFGGGANYNLSKHFQVNALLQFNYKTLVGWFPASTVNQNHFSPALYLGAGYRF